MNRIKIIGSSPTERVSRMRDNFLSARPTMSCERALIYTEVYENNEGMPVILKRAVALKETLSRISLFILPDELIVGHPAALFRSAEVFPEINIKFMEDIECFDTREYNRLQVSPDTKKSLYQIWSFWSGKTLHDMHEQTRPNCVKQSIKHGLLSNPHEWSGFAHVAMDYRKILNHGIEGMLEEIHSYQELLKLTDPEYPQKSIFYRACEIVLEGVLIYAKRYQQLVLQQLETEIDSKRKNELHEIYIILSHVPAKPPSSFWEAIQAFWFMQLIPQIESNGFSITPGRFDQYMWPFLEFDLANKRITLEEAQELVDMIYLKCSEIMRVDSNGAAEVNAGYASGQNLVVGGVDNFGNDATNLLSLICLRANYHVRLHQPNFTVRLHKNTPEYFLEAVVESISCGNGMPQLLNDELIIPSLIRHKIPEEHSRDYIPVGCDEITVHGMWGRCNAGYVNFAKVMELTVNNGREMFEDQMLGLHLDSDKCNNIDEFIVLLNKQLDFAFEMQICEANLTDYIHQIIAPLPFISVFLDDCLLNGKDVTEGGAHYNTMGVVGVGTASFADSLYAVKEMVYGQQKRLTIEELRQLLKNNFHKSEHMRHYIINRLAKFGNDIDEVDEYATYVTNRFFNVMEKAKNYRGGDFWPALYSVSAQVGLGNYTAATPDGRQERLPLSDGLTPMYGLDTKGPTASMNSITKVELDRAPNGVIVNQRLVQALFATLENRKKVMKLLRYFVDKGGFHWQFNIVDNEVLKQAQKDPDSYRGLVVRVAGYSAIFVELSIKAQNSIIERYGSDLAG